MSPDTASIAAGASQQFFATVSGTSNTAVKWTASAGRITSGGMFTAPMVSSAIVVTVTATSMADQSQKASGAVTVAGSNPGPPSALTIRTSALPPAAVGSSYAAGLSAAGGTPPYSWSVAGGALPAGIQLDPTSGTLSGTAGTAGQYSFTAKVTDSASGSASAGLVVSVLAAQPPPNSTGFDGPAELPRIYIQSAVADTPSPGAITFVTAGSSFQQALNAARCGDTLQLQAGATFAGAFTFPAKPCDDQHWITIRTSSPNSALPPEGTRLTPCFAGVASLPGPAGAELPVYAKRSGQAAHERQKRRWPGRIRARRQPLSTDGAGNHTPGGRIDYLSPGGGHWRASRSRCSRSSLGSRNRTGRS